MAGAQRGLADEVLPEPRRRSRSPGATRARIPPNAPSLRCAAPTQLDGDGREIAQSKVSQSALKTPEASSRRGGFLRRTRGSLAAASLTGNYTVGSGIGTPCIAHGTWPRHG